MKHVKDVMFRQVITVHRHTTLRQLLSKFAEFHTFPIVPVVERDNILVGIITLKNLLDVLKPAEPEILKTIPFLDEKPIEISSVELSPEMGHLVVVDDIMENKFFAIQEDMSIEETLRLMRLHNKEQLPVINKDKKFTGVIGIFDIVTHLFSGKGIF
jgi:CBS domain-containing protein